MDNNVIEIINNRIAEARENVKQQENNSCNWHFWVGQVNALCKIKNELETIMR